MKRFRQIEREKNLKTLDVLNDQLSTEEISSGWSLEIKALILKHLEKSIKNLEAGHVVPYLGMVRGLDYLGISTGTLFDDVLIVAQGIDDYGNWIKYIKSICESREFPEHCYQFDKNKRDQCVGVYIQDWLISVFIVCEGRKSILVRTTDFNLAEEIFFHNLAKIVDGIGFGK